MEDIESLHHKSSEHARTVWVNWCLPTPSTEPTWLPPTQKELLDFSSRLVDHYQSELGKRLYVEFSGSAIDQVDGFDALIERLHTDGARIGMYSEVIYDKAFWERVMPFVDQLCIKVTYGQFDLATLTEVVNLISEHIDLHINYVVDPAAFKGSVRTAQTLVAAITETTIKLLLPDDYVAVADTATRMDGANALVNRAAAEKRTRQRHGHRGTMIMKQDGVDTEITPRELLTNGINEFYGWSCMAGVEQLVITSSGEILRGWCRQGSVIGYIRDGVIAFPVSAVTCESQVCGSVVDLACSKSWF